MMGTGLLAAILAFHIGRRLQRVVRTAHVTPRLGCLLLGYSHDLISFKRKWSRPSARRIMQEVGRRQKGSLITQIAAGGQAKA